MDARAEKLAAEDAESIRRRFLGPRPVVKVVAYMLPLPPRYAVRCAATNCYLGASLTEAGRDRLLLAHPHYRVVLVEGNT